MKLKSSPSPRSEGATPAAYSVPEFCQAHSISQATFFRMRARNEGPAIFKAGRRTLIAAEAALAWRTRNAIPTGQS